MRTVSYDEILAGLKRAGVAPGDVLLVHSALTPIGYVEGGAATVARALLEAVGPDGTLVAPAFCFAHETVDPPVIDPANDVSEMGMISEAVRNLPGAKRSIAYRHSFSAVGRHADLITDVDPYYSVFDMASSFGKLLGLNAKVLLLGVTWLNSTSHHFAEYLLQVKDRQTVEKNALLRGEDGILRPVVLTDYQPRPTATGEYYSYPHDFNRSGRMLEKLGKVTVSSVGNAVTRLHYMRDLISFLLFNYPVSYNLFAVDPGTGLPEVLPDGVTVTKEVVDGAGRPETAVWSCLRAEDVFRR